MFKILVEKSDKIVMPTGSSLVLGSGGLNTSTFSGFCILTKNRNLNKSFRYCVLYVNNHPPIKLQCNSISLSGDIKAQTCHFGGGV